MSRVCTVCALECPPDDEWEALGFRACPRCNAIWPERTHFSARPSLSWVEYRKAVVTPTPDAFEIPKKEASKMYIIGITGLKGSGKDTVAEMLVKHYGARRIALADKLKEICADVFGLSHEQVHGSEKEVIDRVWGKTPREILQHIGTEGFRAVHPEVWLRHAMNVMYEQPEKLWVVPDVRLPNEAEFLRAHGGVIWQVQRSSNKPSAVGSAHASEVEQSKIKPDYVITNDGSMKLLEALTLFAIEHSKAARLPPR